MKFTILTACHNNEKHLTDCIDSVLKQEYTNIEWIVVDDASEDDSYKALKEIDDPRVKVIRNDTRLYCSSTYNVALKYATGEACGILDADDKLALDAAKVIVKRYNRHRDIGYIYTQHYWCDKNLKKLRKGLSAPPIGNLSLAQTSLKHRKHCFSHWRTFRTRLAKRGVIFPEGLKYAVDKNMGFVLEELSKGAFLNKCLYYYRYHKENMSLQFPGKQKRLWMSLAEKHVNRKHSRVYPIVSIK